MTIIELDHKCIQCRRMSETPGLSMFRSCRSRRLTWTGRLSTSSPSLRFGGSLPAFLIEISRFLNRKLLDLFPRDAKVHLSGLIDFVQRRIERRHERSIRMSPMLTDLMQQLQDVHTYHPGDDGRVIVAVPTTPHTIEQFEVREVHHDGPSVVLHCRPLQDEQARPQEEQPRPPTRKTRTHVHNDFEDLS